jgi:hypothetical protein
MFTIASPQLLNTPMVDKKLSEEGELIDESFKLNVDNFVAEFLWLAEKIHPEKA